MTPGSFLDLPEEGWVIPHHSSLDYCHVRVTGWTKAGRLKVEGYRSHGWTPDHALIRCSILPDKLTDIPSWRTDFLELYEDPCRPAPQVKDY